MAIIKNTVNIFLVLIKKLINRDFEKTMTKSNENINSGIRNFHSLLITALVEINKSIKSFVLGSTVINYFNSLWGKGKYLFNIFP